MINKIRIQNFRSLRDVELNLQQVNLLIGPNNSGKSNFLKAIEILKQYSKFFYYINELDKHHNNEKINSDLPANVFKRVVFKNSNEQTIRISPCFDNNEFIFTFRSFNKTGKIDKSHSFLIYKANIDELKKERILDISDNIINSDASNLASFLYNLRDSDNLKYYQKIERELTKILLTFNRIRFNKSQEAPDKGTYITLGLHDINGNSYWADELSDGVLYFVALISILNQPNAPNLLLLEEPENNIHPRRIGEVIDLIFKLANERPDTQIIMTTHSPIIVQLFRDIPEAVHVFEHDGNETQVKNLKIKIDDINSNAKINGLPELNYTKNLGKNWEMGLLGGIPDDIF